MSLRIAHNVEAAGIARNLGVSADRLAVSLRRLSSGLRIDTAADDAAGLTISEKMRSQIRGLEMADRNVQDGISLLATVEGALNEVHSILQRARELALQWNQGTLSFADKGAIRTEMFALSDEIARIEQGTAWNGRQILTDVNAVLTLQVGANNADTMTISLVDLFGANFGSLVRPNTFFALPWLEADVAGLDSHINDVASARARMGAATNRLEHVLADNGLRREYLMDAESRIRDVDYAREMINITRQQVIQSSGQTMMIFANRSPERLLDLLS